MKTISEVRKELQSKRLRMPNKAFVDLINKKLKELPWTWFHFRRNK